MNPLRQLLLTLADVEGVIGSFVLSDAGGLLATDLPATFDAAAFAEAGPRILRLAELGGSYGEQTRFFVIRFAEYKLYVRVMPDAFLGVLVTPSTSMPALKAAAGVVGRRVEALVAKGMDAGSAVVAPPPALTRGGSAMGASPASTRGGSAIGAPPALTNTQPSMTLPEPEPTSPGGPPRRSIRFRGRAL
jgi:predicted regulator of Ras-like GTPase activity (Roadblock/LC7/MglB family)